MSIRESRNTYATTEVQNVMFNASLGSGNQNAQDTMNFVSEVLGPDGLDRDLVAEMTRAEIRVMVGLNDQNEATNTTPGSVEARWGIGINTERNDFSAISGNSIDGTSTRQGLGSAGGLVNDDPGVITQARTVAAPQFSDTAGGVGGGADFQHFYTDIEWTEMMEHGPVVDATDDIQASVQLVHDALGGSSVCFINGVFYYSVHEVEGARPQFGLPSP